MSIYTTLASTLHHLTQESRGILAADESENTIKKRFDTIHAECTFETRRDYRELLFTTPKLETCINGIILFEETFYQKGQHGILFPELLHNKGILPGIKVDKGLVNLPFSDEKITQGLDGLTERLEAYFEKGARFAKWRMVVRIDENLPSLQAIQSNAEVLARYAACCQAQGLVPIVEPEVLLEGTHDLEACLEVTELTLHCVFQALFNHAIQLEYIILKPNMVMAGNQNPTPSSTTEVAQATLTALRHTVPAAVPSINFLSGGQTPEQATIHLNEMNKLGPHPWLLNFSYSRALQEPVLKTWEGKLENKERAQENLYHRAHLNVLAAQGKVEV